MGEDISYTHLAILGNKEKLMNGTLSSKSKDGSRFNSFITGGKCESFRNIKSDGHKLCKSSEFNLENIYDKSTQEMKFDSFIGFLEMLNLDGETNERIF